MEANFHTCQGEISVANKRLNMAFKLGNDYKLGSVMTIQKIVLKQLLCIQGNKQLICNH